VCTSNYYHSWSSCSEGYALPASPSLLHCRRDPIRPSWLFLERTPESLPQRAEGPDSEGRECLLTSSRTARNVNIKRHQDHSSGAPQTPRRGVEGKPHREASGSQCAGARVPLRLFLSPRCAWLVCLWVLVRRSHQGGLLWSLGARQGYKADCFSFVSVNVDVDVFFV